jgi:hypothetical protein
MVRNRVFSPFDTENYDRFTKTGSGQTEGKHSTQRCVFFRELSLMLAAPRLSTPEELEQEQKRRNSEREKRVASLEKDLARSQARTLLMKQRKEAKSPRAPKSTVVEGKEEEQEEQEQHEEEDEDEEQTIEAVRTTLDPRSFLPPYLLIHLLSECSRAWSPFIYPLRSQGEGLTLTLKTDQEANAGGASNGSEGTNAT